MRGGDAPCILKYLIKIISFNKQVEKIHIATCHSLLAETVTGLSNEILCFMPIGFLLAETNSL